MIAGQPLMSGPASGGDSQIEASGKMLPIEVKSPACPGISDAVHLPTFRAEYGNKTRAGLSLHTDSTIERLAPDVLAAAWWAAL